MLLEIMEPGITILEGLLASFQFRNTMWIIVNDQCIFQKENKTWNFQDEVRGSRRMCKKEKNGKNGYKRKGVQWPLKSSQLFIAANGTQLTNN